MPNLELKQQKVDALTDQLQQAELTVLADYRGLTVAELSRLRGRLRDVGGEFHVAKNTLSRRAATRLGYDELVPYLVGPTGLATGKDPAALVDERGLKQVTDTGAIEAAIKAVIDANPGQLAAYKAKPTLFGWFVGQVMKSTGGKANPKAVNETLKKLLDG